eukprot:471734-Pleurochrysis_carterae.AAC.2
MRARTRRAVVPTTVCARSWSCCQQHSSIHAHRSRRVERADRHLEAVVRVAADRFEKLHEAQVRRRIADNEVGDQCTRGKRI